MLSLNRKIYTLKVPFLKSLDGTVREVFEVLKEENMAIKGGFAKIILGEILKSEGKIKENLAFGYEGKTDLDLLFAAPDFKKEKINEIAKKVNNLKEKFLKLGVNLDEKDVEIMKGDLKDINFIKTFLESRDLTINELIFIPRIETLFFTDKCLRDTINAVGILAANKPGTIWRDCGRLMASPYGMVRLIKFLTEKKVNFIYLPNWWVLSNKREAEKMKRGIFGAYGLFLIEKYKKNEVLKFRFMKILRDLSITKLKKIETFEEEQKLLFEVSRKKEFIPEEKSFQEIHETKLKDEEERKKKEIELKKRQEFCSHGMKAKFICDHCHWNCAIIKCRKCGFVEIIPKGKKIPWPIDELFCNENFIEADVYWDKNGFFPTFPSLNKKGERKEVL